MTKTSRTISSNHIAKTTLHPSAKESNSHTSIDTRPLFIVKFWSLASLPPSEHYEIREWKQPAEEDVAFEETEVLNNDWNLFVLFYPLLSFLYLVQSHVLFLSRRVLCLHFSLPFVLLPSSAIHHSKMRAYPTLNQIENLHILIRTDLFSFCASSSLLSSLVKFCAWVLLPVPFLILFSQHNTRPTDIKRPRILIGRFCLEPLPLCPRRHFSWERQRFLLRAGLWSLRCVSGRRTDGWWKQKGCHCFFLM